VRSPLTKGKEEVSVVAAGTRKKGRPLPREREARFIEGTRYERKEKQNERGFALKPIAWEESFLGPKREDVILQRQMFPCLYRKKRSRLDEVLPHEKSRFFFSKEEGGDQKPI